MPRHSSWIWPPSWRALLLDGVRPRRRPTRARLRSAAEQQYEQAVGSNPAFRAKRMQQECGR